MAASVAVHGALIAAFSLAAAGVPREPAAEVALRASFEVPAPALAPDDVLPEPDTAALPERVSEVETDVAAADDPIAWSEMFEDLAPWAEASVGDGFESPTARLAELIGPPWTVGTGSDGHARPWAHAARREAPSDAPAAAPARPAAPPASPRPRAPGETRGPQFAVEPSSPPYPESARRRGWEGIVILRLSVDASGAVADVAVLVPSGRRVLDACAAETARTWRFRPALHDGERTDGTIDVPVRFRLDAE